MVATETQLLEWRQTEDKNWTYALLHILGQDCDAYEAVAHIKWRGGRYQVIVRHENARWSASEINGKPFGLSDKLKQPIQATCYNLEDAKTFVETQVHA